MTGPLTLGSRLRPADGVLFQDLDGEGVLLNSSTGVYFGLNDVGCRVWQLLDAYQALSDVLAVLLAEYDVSVETLTGDLLALAAELERHQLVVTA